VRVTLVLPARAVRRGDEVLKLHGWVAVADRTVWRAQRGNVERVPCVDLVFESTGHAYLNPAEPVRVRVDVSLMRLRGLASDLRAPHWLRVLLARPGSYRVARRIWEWPRRSAFMEAVAPLFGRSYRGPGGSRQPMERRRREPYGVRMRPREHHVRDALRELGSRR
jgi:hypothetical protein